MNALNVLLRMPRETDAGMSAVEVLNRTPLEQLEKKVKELKRHRPAEEVRKAMVERIAHAPLTDFERLKGIYLKHCGDAPE
jgi:CBS domain-containing protein